MVTISYNNQHVCYKGSELSKTAQKTERIKKYGFEHFLKIEKIIPGFFHEDLQHYVEGDKFNLF